MDAIGPERTITLKPIKGGANSDKENHANKLSLTPSLIWKKNKGCANSDKKNHADKLSLTPSLI